MKYLKCIFLLFLSVQVTAFAQTPCDDINTALIKIENLIVDGKLDQALTALKKIKNDPNVRNCDNMRLVEYKIKDIESKMSETSTQMFEQGEDYFIGRNGKSKDYAKAIEWYNKAADKGNADAMIRLAECYEEGYGVTKDERKGVEYEKKAASLGNAKAQHWLGNTYSHESYGGETQNYAEAVKWYRKSAEQGYAAGQNALGIMFYNGYGVKADFAEAIKWFRKSAEQGYAVGQYNLGYMYEYGYCGVTKNLTEAKKWYEKAAAQGYEDAKQKLKDNKWNNANSFGMVRGVVYDKKTNEPIIGATVMAKKSRNGVITDFDGEFFISASIGEELEIKYVGYKDVTVKVVDDKPIKVYMKETR